jgi:hypothetical protein
VRPRIAHPHEDNRSVAAAPLEVASNVHPPCKASRADGMTDALITDLG